MFPISVFCVTNYVFTDSSNMTGRNKLLYSTISIILFPGHSDQSEHLFRDSVIHLVCDQQVWEMQCFSMEGTFLVDIQREGTFLVDLISSFISQTLPTALFSIIFQLIFYSQWTTPVSRDIMLNKTQLEDVGMLLR